MDNIDMIDMEEENNSEKSAETVQLVENAGGAVAAERPEVIPSVTNEARAYAEQTAAVEKRQAELEEQDKKLLAALDEVLEKRTQQMRDQQKRSQMSKAERFAGKVVKKGVGFVSLGLILTFLGIIMLICLLSPNPDFYLLLKLSPICAVLVGIELLLNQLMTRGNFRINIPSIVISALLVVGCCVMCVSLNSTYKQDKQEYNNRSIAAEIYDRSYKELRYVADIASITVDIDLNPDGSGAEKGVDALSVDDNVNIKVAFAGTYRSSKSFAADCKKIIDGYRIMGINVTNFYFSNKSTYNSYNLAVEGKYAQDYSESRLEEQVFYIHTEDYDYLEDLEDYEEGSVNSQS